MLLRSHKHSISLDRPRVMGILNVTPDSFSDGGHYLDPSIAYERACQMVDEGADFIDVGGESTRPGAAAVSELDELRRVIPVIERIATLPVIISIDSSKARVMREACEAGASLINDVYALRQPAALEAAHQAGAAVCLMHMQGEPRMMQDKPTYDDVVADVKKFLSDRIQACLSIGIPADRILVDPGFGFGKTLAHNLALLARLSELEQLGRPILVGLSRKSMLGTVTGRPVEQRLHAGVAAAVTALERGAKIIRTHDVAATVDAVKLMIALDQQHSEIRA